jgi:hypothetical protein
MTPDLSTISVHKEANSPRKASPRAASIGETIK